MTTIQLRKINSGLQAYIHVPTKKGQREESLCADGGNIGSRKLNQALHGDLRQIDGLEVEYEMEDGHVKRVRGLGQPCDITPTVAAQNYSRNRQQGGGRGGQHGYHQGQPQHHQMNQNQPPQGNGPRFENPYNFVPAPGRTPADVDLGDHLPKGHHRYHSDHWSGHIQVRMITQTPLLIPDAARLEKDGEHSILPLRIGPDGAPYLPPTSVKGMLRTAYEAITNSRFGVFKGHDERLPFRMNARDGLQLVPARIEVIRGIPQVTLLPGQSRIDIDGRPIGRLMYAAWLSRYRKYRPTDNPVADKGESTMAKRYTGLRTIPPHQSYVHVRLSRQEHRSGRFDYLKIEEIVSAISGSPIPVGWEAGWVCITGRNIMNKHDEKVFLEQGGIGPISLNPGVIHGWEVLIKDYQSIHEAELDKRKVARNKPEDYLGHNPGDTGWSRHVYDPAMCQLSNNTLCYAKVKSNGKSFDVLALYPVMISRDLYEKAPSQLLPETLRPVQRREELSPADRVFGWVNGNGEGAFRGQLRVGPVTCDQGQGMTAIERLDNNDPQGLALAILGQPKPQQERFYAAQDTNSNPMTAQVPKGSGYKLDTQGLRGRKFYPHQKQCDLPGYWTPEIQSVGQQVYQEYRRLPDLQHPNGIRDSQNRSIRAWVKKDSTFHFDLQVTNLSKVELGALLWLLKLDNGHFLKLGFGKSLGFGSVRLEIESLDLRDGSAQAKDYLSLNGRATDGGRIKNPEGCNALINHYKDAVKRIEKVTEFENISFIRAFLNAARGGELPVHYPRTDGKPSSDSKVYEWFVKNENGGKGPRHSLPSLEQNDRGLPYLT